MLAKKYNSLQREVKKNLKGLKRGRKMTEAEFDAFIKKILACKSLEESSKVYCRDGFAYVNKLDKHTYQLICFQINSFGGGIFGKQVVKLCTPILLTLTVHGSHYYLEHSLKDACISIDEFYLGKSFCGSKGKLCDRDSFNEHAKELFLSQPTVYSFNHQIIYQLMNANYLCHHIAEVMGYAFGALDVYWTYGKNVFFLSSGSFFNQSIDKLFIDIIDDFSSDKMNGYFQVPHYAKLMEDPKKFREEFDTLTWEVRYRGEMETFYLPIGYQKIHKKMFHKNVNVITSQHMIEHLLTEYYKRKNAFVVANTFQTLEYLSRAFIAKKEGRNDECNAFVRAVSTCLGHYPERNFEDFYREKEAKYLRFVSEYSHSVFFRPPVLS
jgi:hypothetical protein